MPDIYEIKRNLNVLSRFCGNYTKFLFYWRMEFYYFRHRNSVKRSFDCFHHSL